MRVTFSDFAAFVIAACFVVAVFVAPYIMAWHYLDSHFSREGAHDSRPLAEGSGLALPGAPNAPSQPGNPVPHTGGKGGAMLPSSDPARCLSVLGEARGSAEGYLVDTQVPDDGQRDRTRTGSANAAKCVTDRRDSHSEDSFRSGFFALTWGGDPSQEMGRGGASLEGAFGSGAETERSLVTHEGGLLRRVQPSSQSRTGGLDRPAKHMDLRPHHLQTLANAAAGLCGIDPALFWSLVLRESSGRHWDAEGRVLRSSSNALGLGQIKASTARGVSPLLDPLKPWDNAVAAACHLRALLDANKGNVRKSLHDYHAGAYRKRTSAATLAYASDILGAN